ncbi:MAG: hypothetical protein KDI79_19060 [Anaerolineae bacterium]|nr:hypothetical protein [Anaerolineae bacterium]
MPVVDPEQLDDMARRRNLPKQEVLADLYFQETFPDNLGWKHSLVKPVDQLRQYTICSDSLLFLTLTKNPYSWLLSLYRRPYHHLWREKPDFETFLTAPWRTVGRENAPDQFSSPVELWNQKNGSYLQLQPQFPTLNLRYEALLADPEGAVEAVRNITSCDWKQRPFVNIDGATKRDEKNFTFYRNYYLKEQWQEKLSPRSIELINERLNDEILEAFQYDKLT